MARAVTTGKREYQREPRSIHLAAKVTQSMRDRVEERAIEDDVTTSDVVRAALAAYLKPKRGRK